MAKNKLFPHGANILWVSPKEVPLLGPLFATQMLLIQVGLVYKHWRADPAPHCHHTVTNQMGTREGSGSSVQMDINYNFVGWNVFL